MAAGRAIVVATSLMLLAGKAVGQTAGGGSLDDASIDAVVRSHFADHRPPGLALAVARDGEATPRVFVYGLADLEQDRPVSSGSIFPIASITKTLTAIAILELQRQDRLAVLDTLGKYVPEFPNASAITLYELLVHSSGIADFTRLQPFLDAQAQDWTPQEIVRLAANAPAAFPPGSRCSYNDTGYVLLGLVIEKVSGQSYADFVREHVALPLGMTTVRPGDHSAIVPHRAAGYVIEQNVLRNAPYVSLRSPFAAGEMVGAVGDLARLGEALHPGGTLLSGASYGQMTAPVALAGGQACVLPLPGATATYGYGLEIVTFDDIPHRAIGKSGVFPGYSSYVAHFEDTPLTIAALANLDGSLPFIVSVVHDVAKAMLAVSGETK